MAAPAFGTAGTYLSGTATTASIAVPSSVASGDVILVHLYIESTNTVTPPAGFTELTNSPISTTGAGAHSFHVFWKRASGADSGTYAFTYGGVSVYREGVATRYTGCIATGDPTEINNGAQRSSNGTTTPAVSGTTLGADRLLVWGATDFSSGTWTMPSSFTRRDPGTNESPVATLAQTSAGSTGSLTGSCTASNFMTAFLTALIPPDPGVTVPDTGSGSDTVAVDELVAVSDTGTAADLFIPDSAGVTDTATGSDSVTAFDGELVAGGDTAAAVDTLAVLDVQASTLLALRPGAAYEAVVVARVPSPTGPPTLTVVDDIRWTTIDWTSELSTPQSASITCSLSTLTEPVLQRFRSAAALATEIWVLRNGQIVCAGPLTSLRRSSEDVTITSAGLLAYLDRMVVFSDLVYSQTDQFGIVAALVNHWQGRAYGNFGIDTTTAGTSGVLRDATYLAKELHPILKRVQEMGQRINGFDVDVDPASRALQLWFPTRGVDRSTGEDAIVFDTRNITSASTMFSVSPQHVATVGFGTGTSSDAGTLYGTATNADLLAQYGASAVTATWDSVSEQTTLDGHVAGLLAARGDVLFVPGPDVRVTPDADVGAYDVGDTVRYELDDQLGIEGAFRLRSIKVTVSSSGVETVSPTFV